MRIIPNLNSVEIYFVARRIETRKTIFRNNLSAERLLHIETGRASEIAFAARNFTIVISGTRNTSYRRDPRNRKELIKNGLSHRPFRIRLRLLVVNPTAG